MKDTDILHSDFQDSELRPVHADKKDLMRYIEEKVTECVSSVLEIESKSTDRENSFFAYGTDSFMAIRITNRINMKLGISLDFETLFEPESNNVRGLSARIHTEYGEDILALLSENSAGKRPDSVLPDIPTVSRNTDIPLSFFQQICWPGRTSDTVSSSYNHNLCFRIKGDLNVKALKQSFDEIILRHEILRTSFQVKKGFPVQVILPASPVSMTVKDMQELPEKDQSREAEKMIMQENQRPFDLSGPSMLRITLVCLGEKSHVLAICMHHIITDMVSLVIFLQELSILYDRFASDKPFTLPCLPIQYADFALWQRQHFTRQMLKAGLGYWKEWLEKEPPGPDLPYDRPRPDPETFQAGYEWYQFSPGLTQQLRTFSQESGTTLFVTLQAAFVALLCQYARHGSIALTISSAARRHHQLEHLIGTFGMGLELCFDILGISDFRELVAHVKKVNLSALADQGLPSLQFIKKLQPTRNLRSNPLSRVLMIFLPYEDIGAELKLTGLDIKPFQTEMKVRRDLILSMNEGEKVLGGHWLYKRDLFDAETVVGIAENFRIIIEAIVADPDQPLEQLSALFQKR